MAQSRQVSIFETGDALADFMAGQWHTLSLQAIRNRGYFVAALSGGATPVPFYKKLAAAGTRIMWDKIHLFFADERFVPSTSTDSNYRLLQETLLNTIPIPDGNIHPVITGTSDPLASAREYEDELKRFFGLQAGDLPEFDLIVLGIGADGHTASLFPGNVALQDSRHLARAVVLSDERHDRITLTLPVLNNARTVVFLVTGKAKASVLFNVIEKRDRRLPASLVEPAKGEVLFLADAEAAQYLPESIRTTGL